MINEDVASLWLKLLVQRSSSVLNVLLYSMDLLTLCGKTVCGITPPPPMCHFLFLEENITCYPVDLTILYVFQDWWLLYGGYPPSTEPGHISPPSSCHTCHLQYCDLTILYVFQDWWFLYGGYPPSTEPGNISPPSSCHTRHFQYRTTVLSFSRLPGTKWKVGIYICCKCGWLPGTVV